MNKAKLIINLGTTLATMIFSASISAATLTYNWAGNHGVGSITFFDTNISDPENFSVAFDTENVANISYTFDNGNSIEDASNFSGSSTLQSPSELGNSMFTASNGVIEGWTFEYSTVQSFIPIDISYLGSSTTGSIACITTPCPVDTATITFIGNYASETNAGNWNIQPVPLPAAVWLFITGLAGVFGYGRFSNKA